MVWKEMKTKEPAPLEFSLDPKSGVPFYKQIIQQVEMAVADGRLSSGSQLPTVRALAVEVQVNPNTVARAYNELEIRGIVNTQQGTGTFISDKQVTLSEIEREGFIAQICQNFYTKITSYGLSVEEVVSYLRELERNQDGGKL
jgi:GntR family transcriptional regulator